WTGCILMLRWRMPSLRVSEENLPLLDNRETHTHHFSVSVSATDPQPTTAAADSALCSGSFTKNKISDSKCLAGSQGPLRFNSSSSAFES
ncbi:mCG146114, partial [Mus musculus]